MTITQHRNHASAVKAGVSPVKKLWTKDQSVTSKPQPTRMKGPAIVVDALEDWLLPKCKHFSGMLVSRPLWYPDLQWYVDDLARSGALGDEQAVDEEICFQSRDESKDLDEEISERAQKLADLVVRNGIPRDVGQQIKSDLESCAKVLKQLTPSVKCMHLKVDIVGDFSCVRWHRDRYMGRAVITYNGGATQFIADHHADLWQLENGGKNEQTVPNESFAHTPETGDILFMKGTNFPTAPRGLVHRAPPRNWHEGGSVMNRLLLKIDVN